MRIQPYVAADMHRRVNETHPWISFTLNMKRFPPELWMLFGEARSKCEHLAHAAIRPRTAARLMTISLVKGAHATTSIEGNSLTEDEVAQILRGDLEVPKSKEYLAQEVRNIEAACNEILRRVVARNAPLDADAEYIRKLNAQVLADLSTADHVEPGEYRTCAIGVRRYRGPDPGDVAPLVDGLCEWLVRDFPIRPCLRPPGDGEMDPLMMALLGAVLAHLYIAWIHPFGDGNGRSARLLEYSLLLSAGIPAPAGHILSNHYNDTRAEYYRQLDYASTSGGDVIPFILYAVRGFVEGMRAIIKQVEAEQLNIAWRNYIHEEFARPGRKLTVTQRRRRSLVLALSQVDAPVPRKHLKYFARDVAVLYEGKTEKTVSRDVSALHEMDLIRRSPEGWEANFSIILKFLSPRVA